MSKCRAGLPSPQPLLLRGHVIVMSFIGADGWPAPQVGIAVTVAIAMISCLSSQLREARITSVREWATAYAQTVAIMHALYNW
jgi:serine/threonine-protein kinase RIO1